MTYVKCQLFCSFSPFFLLLNPYGALPPLSLPSSLYSFPLSHINVMSLTVRVRENRAASTILPFFSEFYCLCLSHLQALVHKCSCVLSIHFYQLCGLVCMRRSLKVTVPRELQKSYSRLYIDISFMPIGIT